MWQDRSLCSKRTKLAENVVHEWDSPGNLGNLGQCHLTYAWAPVWLQPSEPWSTPILPFLDNGLSLGQSSLVNWSSEGIHEVWNRKVKGNKLLGTLGDILEKTGEQSRIQAVVAMQVSIL